MPILKLIRSKWILTVPLLLVLAVAMACGGGDAATPTTPPTPTPQPTPTPVDFGALTQEIRGIVDQGIQGIEGLSAADVEGIVNSAIAAIPEGLSAAEVQTIVASAIGAIPEGLSAAEVQTIVATAISAIPEGLSAEQVQAIVAQAISEIPEGLTVSQMEAAVRTAVDAGVQRAVSEAVAQIPPTATPLPESLMMGILPNQGVLPLHAFTPPRLDMPHINGITTIAHSAPSYNSLTEINPETAVRNVVRCDLCESWSVADDGVTYTFKLHEGAVWHDGEAVTSEDVVLSLELINQPARLQGYDVLKEYIGGRRHDRNVLWLYYDSSRALDDYTVEVTIQRPTPAFLQALSWDYFPMYPEHELKQGILPSYSDVSTLIGSGPFKIVQYEKDVLSEQERNTEYFKEGKPYFDGLIHHVIRGKNRVVAAYTTGQVLMPNSVVNQLSPRDAKEFEDQLRGQSTFHWTEGYPAAWGVMLNVERAPFDNPDVRQAVGLALHRQPIVETFGGVNPIGTPLPTGFSWSYTLEEGLQMRGIREDSPGVKSAADIAEAQRLTVEAGAGPGTKVTLLCGLTSEVCDLAVLVKEQLGETLGWDITINQQESRVAAEARETRNYQFAIASGGVLNYDPDGAALFFRKGTGRYYTQSGHEDAELERIWEGVTTETDPAVRKALILEANNAIIDRGALHIIYYQVFTWIVDNRIQNFNLAPAFLTHMKHEHLWCDPRCT